MRDLDGPMARIQAKAAAAAVASAGITGLYSIGTGRQAPCCACACARGDCCTCALRCAALLLSLELLRRICRVMSALPKGLWFRSAPPAPHSHATGRPLLRTVLPVTLNCAAALATLGGAPGMPRGGKGGGVILSCGRHRCAAVPLAPATPRFFLNSFSHEGELG